MADKTITIDVPVDSGYDSYELRLFSDRNNPVVKESDVSSYDPNPETKIYGTAYEGMYNFNYLFPVIDFKYQSSMEGVLTFEGVFYGTWAMNPMYHSDRFALSEKVAIPSGLLEWWENMFHYDNPQAWCTGFYVRKAYPSNTVRISEKLELLSDKFDGKYQIFGLLKGEETLLYEEEVHTEHPPFIAPSTPIKITKESLLFALDADLEYIFKAQNKNPDSAMTGGTHLFYDYDAKTFRQRNWLWTFGPSMQTLLLARDIPEMAEKYGKDNMLQMATEMAEVCINHQELDESKTNYGMLLCRLEHNVVDIKEGYELKYSPPDGLFQVGWGMIPLYRATGDTRYLKFGQKMVEATGKLLDLDVIVQQDYFAVTGSWKTNTMDEAGFGMEGIAEVYAETKDPLYAELGKKYIDQLISYFETEEGTWSRNYFRHSRTVEPPFNLTRGMGWAMMGLSSAVRMNLGDQYLDKCRKMAQVLMKYQNEDGSWWYRFDTPDPVNGIAEKGTAVWTVMFYRLYSLTGNTDYLETARKALTWLMNNQYFGEDRDGYGGIPIIGPMSGVAYRPFFKMSCQYTAGFLGLALLEEMKLSN